MYNVIKAAVVTGTCALAPELVIGAELAIGTEIAIGAGIIAGGLASGVLAIAIAYYILSRNAPPQPNDTVARLDHRFGDSGGDDDSDELRTLVGDIDLDRDATRGCEHEKSNAMEGDEKNRDEKREKDKEREGKDQRKGEKSEGRGEKNQRKREKGDEKGKKPRRRKAKEPTRKQYEDAKDKIRYSHDRFHFAMCGEAGGGKSSLTNALRGLSDHDNGSATVKVTEGTRHLTRYPHPRTYGPFGRFVWYDCPGAGTLNVPAKGYFNNQGLFLFDFIVLVWDIRFTEHDAEVLQSCADLNVRVFVVRSKTDQHIDNAMKSIDARAYHASKGSDPVLFKRAKEQVEHDTRENFKSEIEKCELGSRGPRQVYMVSNHSILQLISDFEAPLHGLEGQQAEEQQAEEQAEEPRGKESQGKTRFRFEDFVQRYVFNGKKHDRPQNEELPPPQLEDYIERYIIDDRKLLTDMALTAVRRRYEGELQRCVRIVGERGYDTLHGGYESFLSSLKQLWTDDGSEGAENALGYEIGTE